jgi:hypothetical protein
MLKTLIMICTPQQQLQNFPEGCVPKVVLLTELRLCAWCAHAATMPLNVLPAVSYS